MALPEPTPVPDTDTLSWWVSDFDGLKEREQGRMRRELPAPAVQRALDAALWLEQQELLGFPTARCVQTARETPSPTN